MIDTLKHRLAEAEAMLAEALVSGIDTSAARAVRDDAARELAAAEEAREDAVVAAAQQQAEAIAARAVTLAHDASASLQSRLAQFTNRGMTMPVSQIQTPTDSAIAAAAQQLAGAEAAAAKTSAAMKDTQDQRDRLAGRIADLDAQRAAIISRRAGGHKEADDGSRLALLAADLEGLNGLLVGADQQIAVKRAAHATAARAMESASFGLSDAKDNVLLARLMTHFSDLDVAMLKVLVELESIAGRLNLPGRPAWGASPDLYHRIRKLAAQRGEM
jgi:hypothetical protein